jgi:hypothetical protein
MILRAALQLGLLIGFMAKLDLASPARNVRKRLRRLVLFAAPRSRNGPTYLSL